MTDTIKFPTKHNRIAICLGALLFLYLALYFIFPYKPFHLLISPGSIVLICGIVFSFIASAMLVHHRTFSWRPGFFAYIFSFLCYMFVRYAVKYTSLIWLYKGMLVYLIISGILILLQANAASNLFYPAIFLSSTSITPIHQGWGFADISTVAGGITLWMLSIAVALYSFCDDSSTGIKSPTSRFLSMTAIAIGSAGLFYTSCRAAWAGMAIAFISIPAVLLFLRKTLRHFFQATAIFIFTFSICLISPRKNVYRLQHKINFMSDVLIKPSVSLKDVSTHIKLEAWALAASTIKSNPLWGIGVDQFPDLYYKKVFLKLNPLATHIDSENAGINAQNSFLSYMVEVGLLSSLFLFWLMAWAIYKSLAYLDSSSFSFLIGFLTVCVWAIFCDFLKERLFWIALAMLVGLAANPSPASE